MCVNIDRQNALYDVCRGVSILGRSFFTGLCILGVVSPPIGRSNCLGGWVWGWGVHCVVAEMHLMIKLFAEIVGLRLYSVCSGLVSNIGRQFSLYEWFQSLEHVDLITNFFCGHGCFCTIHHY